MLKVEKYYQNNQIKVGIVLQKSSSLITPAFLIGLSIALILHIAPFYFFKLPSNQLNYLDLSPLQPVNLTIDFDSFIDSSFQKNGLVEIDSIHLTRNHAATPPETKIEFLHPKWIAPIIYTSSFKIIENEKIDNKIDELDIAFLEKSPLEFPLKFSKYSIEVFGNLAGNLIDTELPDYIESTYKNIEKTMALFEVVVENTNGKIIWYEAKNSVSPKILKSADEIIKKLKFNLNFVEAYTKGEIEITFNELKND